MREVAKEGFVEACMIYPTLINKYEAKSKTHLFTQTTF